LAARQQSVAKGQISRDNAGIEALFDAEIQTRTDEVTGLHRPFQAVPGPPSGVRLGRGEDSELVGRRWRNAAHRFMIAAGGARDSPLPHLWKTSVTPGKPVILP